MLSVKSIPCSSALPRFCTSCKAQEMTKIDDEWAAGIKAVGQRMAALIQLELKPVEYMWKRKELLSCC